MRELFEKVDTVSIKEICGLIVKWRGLLGITYYFSLDWSFYLLILGCNRFRGQHNAENIAHNYVQSISFYKLNDKVTHKVSDTASNMLKTFRSPGFDMLIADELNSEPSDEEGEGNIVQSVGITDSIIYHPEHDPCFSHTLQHVKRWI